MTEFLMFNINGDYGEDISFVTHIILCSDNKLLNKYRLDLKTGLNGYSIKEIKDFQNSWEKNENYENCAAARDVLSAGVTGLNRPARMIGRKFFDNEYFDMLRTQWNWDVRNKKVIFLNLETSSPKGIKVAEFFLRNIEVNILTNNYIAVYEKC